MKTSVILESNVDRNLFGIVIKQQTKSALLSLTDLQKAYNKKRILKGWSEKQVVEIFKRNLLVEKVFYLLKKQSVIDKQANLLVYENAGNQELEKSNLLSFMQTVDKHGLIKVLKGLNQYKTMGRGENKETWCNPYIWVAVALEMHPEIYAEVIFWLTDKLLFNREAAGDMYRPLCAQFQMLMNKDTSKFTPAVQIEQFRGLARFLNLKVFGKHESGIRNTASEKELESLLELEKLCAHSIKCGMIKTPMELKYCIEKYEPII